MAWQAQAHTAPRDRRQGAASAAANPFALLGDGDDGDADDDDEEMAEAVLGCQLGK